MAPTLSLPLPKAILWDMDGTLIDQTAAIIRTYGEVIQFINGSLPDPQIILRSLGGPMASTLALFIDEKRLEEASIRFRKRFPEIMLDGLIVLTGALNMIECSHKESISQAILTNKHGDTARAISKHVGFSKYISICVGSKDTDWHKPQIELTHYVLNQIETSVEDACIIGDSPTDIETAHNAGLYCYCITTGAHSAEELSNSGADAVFDSLVTLKNAFGL